MGAALPDKSLDESLVLGGCQIGGRARIGSFSQAVASSLLDFSLADSPRNGTSFAMSTFGK